MAHALPNEADLIARAQRGESSAQQDLWRSHRRWVAAIILAHRPRAIEVDDLMQDVAVKFVGKLDTLRDIEAFRPWLRQIAINVCRGAARSHRPHLRLAEEGRDDFHEPGRGPLAPSDGAPDAAARATSSEAARHVMARVRSLPPEYREPLLLRCVRGLTYQQIGAILDLPVTTIETRLARARRMLREECGEEVPVV
jgi:RNA polymerase sigma-70 factor (ECF subfamily)